MPKFRKRPVVIEAEQVPTNPDEILAHGPVWALFFRAGFKEFCVAEDKGYDITTLEGVMHASPGDYIIRGVKGEFYPVKNDIFIETYEAVDVEGEQEQR